MILSSDSIIGNRYDYYYPTITVTVGPVSKEKLFDYLPEEKNMRIIEKLNQYFMPVYCETEVIIEEYKYAWTLGADKKNDSRLGYSMALKKNLKLSKLKSLQTKKV